MLREALWPEASAVGGRMHFLRFALPIAAFACLLCASAGATTVLTGYVGSHKLSYSVAETSSVISESHGPADYLAITEVYPDVPGSAEYHYSVEAKSIGSYERRRRGIGFGPETYFIRAKNGSSGAVSLRSLSKEPFRLLPMWSVKQAELDKLLAKDSFRILGLASASDDGEKLVKLLAENLKPKPEYHISTGFSAEIRYANQPADRVRRDVENCAKWSKQYSLPAMLGLVAWWSGTPLWESDGQGGRFGDIKYQQVCYAPDSEQPEDANLKALLGDRYNRHYCLSVPNQWSSTPWLTMNSRALNDYRYKRMDEAVALLKETGKGNARWIDSIYLENEPRYWDTDCEAGNDKRHAGTLWADFNPLVIEAAKKDGIDLNPSDGLSNEELLWLHRNVGKYNQECVDAVNKSLGRNGLASGLPVYTHSLQLKEMFPGGRVGHPASEWAYASGVRSGIEGMWSQPSDFARTREWGRWANVNREENDGRHIDEHLWDLRVTYMMGGDLYNSYNWPTIGAQRFFDYVNEFLRELPVVTLPPAEIRAAGSSIEIKTPMKLQAFTGLTVSAGVLKPGVSEVRLVVNDKDGRLIGCSRIAVKPGRSVLSFEFAEPVESPCRETAVLKLEAFDKHGKLVADGISFAEQSPASDVKLSLDLRTQRALSLAVIARAGR